MLGRKKRFVLTVGDDGAILTLTEGNRLKERLFAPSPISEEAEKIKALLTRNKKVPILILIDILDQSYNQHNIPQVSSFTVKKLIKRKLTKDFNLNDIKTAVKQQKSNSQARKGTTYLFISIPNIPPLSEWIEMAVDMPNKFGGTYALPLEMENIIGQIDKEVKGEKKSVWKILVTHNKVGGVRQVVFRDGKFVITRINQPVGVSDPEVIAGNIEQDLVNTVEFIRRMGFEEKDGLDVVVVASNEIKVFLENGRLKANNIFFFSPFDLAEKLGLKNAAAKEDKFSDVVVAANFAAYGKFKNKLYSKSTEKLGNIDILDKLVVNSGYIGVAVLLAYGMYQTKTLYELAQEYKLAAAAKQASVSQLEGVKQEAALFPEDTGKVVNSIYFYNMLTGNNDAALVLLKKFSEVKGEKNLAKIIRVKIIEPDINKRPLETGSDIGRPDSPKVTLSMGVEMQTQPNIEQILEASEQFTSALKKAFTEQAVKFKNLPNRDVINTNIGNQSGSNSSAPVEVEIEWSPQKPEVVPPPADPAKGDPAKGDPAQPPVPAQPPTSGGGK